MMAVVKGKSGRDKSVSAPQDSSTKFISYLLGCPYFSGELRVHAYIYMLETRDIGEHWRAVAIALQHSVFSLVPKSEQW